ncbi:hypothetical protein AYI69_g5709, partial [Smittium culicis]
MEELQDG